MRTLFLFGTAHSLQIGTRLKNSVSDAQLKSEFKNHCLNQEVDLIAEEMSEEALMREGIDQTIAQIVGEELGISHLFCDPSSQVRAELGISDTQRIRIDSIIKGWDKSKESEVISISWDRRENYILEQIYKRSSSNVLLICGSNHVEAFSQKAQSKGYLVNVVQRDWESKNA